MTTTLSDTVVATTTSRPRRVLAFVGQVAAWSVILVIGAALAVAVVIPRVGGATPYTVLTGSMSPSMPPGTLAVVRPSAPEEVGVGTVITYQLRSGQPTVVTHRVVAVGVNAAGDRVFTTRGDANDAVDAAAVRPVQVRGALWYSVPYLGYVSNVLNGQQRQTAVYLVAGALLLYAGCMFTGAVRGSRSRRGAESTS